MIQKEYGVASLTVEAASASVTSLVVNRRELIAAPCPLFTIGLRKKDGSLLTQSAYDAKCRKECGNQLLFSEFPEPIAVAVTIDGEFVDWRIRIENKSDALIEWVNFPSVTLRPLKQNGGEGTVLFPYNEGVLIDDLNRKQATFPYTEPLYPSCGAYCVFPNMICSQFMSYLIEDYGLNILAVDPERGVKWLDLRPEQGGVTPILRIWCGGAFGEDYESSYPIRLTVTAGDWYASAEEYRNWFASHLPHDMKKVQDNPNLPEWYEDMPLVVTYPVRGLHDMDEMTPNAFFPYTYALPILDEIAEKTGMRLLVLLMHWEGTAPWAPPEVWPPYGGEDALNEFADALHKRGHLLGVYCSGFGFTEQSNLIADYSQKDRLSDPHVWRGFCASPSGVIEKSRICTGQRSGYDLCVGSEVGKEILNRAYAPLFESKLDYIQILDQNHGGGQYFCYARDHGHSPAPGPWMTSEMRKLLSGWQEKAKSILFGCESAAAEPFLPYLLLSDNRFELNYMFGQPVPLHAYLYHEYLHNFMGNQVCCGLSGYEDTLCLRMAYSFVAGDLMTLILHPDGTLLPQWGWRDFSVKPDRDAALTLAANLGNLTKSSFGRFLSRGKLLPCPPISCAEDLWTCNTGKIAIPRILAALFELDGQQCLFLVNHTKTTELCHIEGETYSVPPLNGLLISRTQR